MSKKGRCAICGKKHKLGAASGRCSICDDIMALIDVDDMEEQRDYYRNKYLEEYTLRWSLAEQNDTAERYERKLAKVEAERDALKLQVADMERDRDVWRADANVLRDPWMAAVKVNNALKEERTKLKGDNGDPFTFWKSIVKKDIDTDA